jgi:hypothetical protein
MSRELPRSCAAGPWWGRSSCSPVERGRFPESLARLLHTIRAHGVAHARRLRTLHEEEQTRLQSIIDSMPNGVS